MESPALDRLLALARRELGALDAWVQSPDDAAADDHLAGAPSRPHGHRISVALPNEHALVAILPAEVDDVEAKARRLEMLAETFREILDPNRSQGSRPPPAQSLHEALEALRARAEAFDALVIEAQSPVVWARAGASVDAEPWLGPPPDNVVELRPGHDAAHAVSGGEGHTSEKVRAGTPVPPMPDEKHERVERALGEVRALSAMATLHKGAHLHHAERRDELGWIARSFAGIYVLVLVFDRLYDELRAERAIALSLPVIERLVTALPPIDPEPFAGAAAMRRRR